MHVPTGSELAGIPFLLESAERIATLVILLISKPAMAAQVVPSALLVFLLLSV